MTAVLGSKARQAGHARAARNSWERPSGVWPSVSQRWAPLLRDRHIAHRRDNDYFLYEGAGVGGATLKRHATWRVTKTKKPPGDEVRPDVAVATPLLYVSPKPPPPLKGA